MKTTPLIVVIGAVTEDCAALGGILRRREWKLACFRTHRDALLVLRRAWVVICDAELPDGGWRDVLRNIGPRANSPLLIVAGRLADDRLWAEVLNEGGHDVLAKPFRPAEVLQSVTSACRWREDHASGNGR